MSSTLSTLEKVLMGIGVGVLISLAISGVGLVFAWPIKWTWNVTMPYLFGLPAITWGKAWVIGFLAGCLIKSIITSKS